MTGAMRDNTLANHLDKAAREVGVYKTAIQQKKDQKEELAFHKETLIHNIKCQKNSAKQITILSGRLRQKIND